MLSQSVMDRVARHTIRMQGSRVEPITYHAKANVTSTAVDYDVEHAYFGRYSDDYTALHAVAAERPQVLREDERLRLPTFEVSWAPTIYDTVTRADGTIWRVLSVQGGRREAWYLLQVRKVIAV